MKILVINPGATSTKVAVFEDEQELFKQTIDHEESELAGFDRIVDQKDFRKRCVETTLFRQGYSAQDFDAVAGRGGLLKHIPSGTYAITDDVISDIEQARFGEHASNLGPVLALDIARSVGIPAFFVDPVSVDEMEDVARISGFKGMERQSFFHALNHKSVARKAAKLLGRAYEDINLVVAHMGGGVSVAAHRRGRVIDVFNVKDEGSFSMDRGGGLPVNAVIDYCFSGATKAEVKRTLGGKAGVLSYLGTRDFREILQKMEAGDPQADLVYRAMVYQHAKDIGAMAAILHFSVDAIVLTGGIAHSDRLCEDIAAYVSPISKILRIPGEEEMSSLAEGTLSVLRGGVAKEY